MYFGRRWKSNALIDPSTIDTELLELTNQFKATGDLSIRNKIFDKLKPRADTIAKRYAKYFPQYYYEILSEAYQSILDCLSKCKERMKDDNILPYVSACINGRISLYLRKGRFLIAVNRGEYMDYSVGYHYARDDEDNLEYCNDGENWLLPPVIDDDDLVTQELIDHFEGIDRTIVIKLNEGYTYEEISDKIGCSKQAIGKRIEKIRGRVAEWQTQGI